MSSLTGINQEAELERLGITYDKEEYPLNSRIAFSYSIFWSLCFLAASPIAAILSGENLDIFHNLFVIITSPSLLITDYFNIGGFGSTLLNAALCGLFCNFAVLITRAKSTSNILAGYFLVVAHCFYGLNILNMLPTFFGVVLFCKVTRRSVSENLHLAMFSTSLAPFISDFLFRYPDNDGFVFGKVELSLLGIVLSIILGLAAGAVVPALLPGTTRMHKGFNLYKAGLAIGLLGCFIFAFLYRTFGIEEPNAVSINNVRYSQQGALHMIFMNVFFAFIFISSIIAGYLLNGKTFKGYKDIFYSSGHNVDFARHFGMPDCLINIGFYGFFILVCFNIIFLCTDGVGYTGPSVGVTIAALTFSSSGQNPRNVWPIFVGFALLYGLVLGICTLSGIEMPWSLSTQCYLNGLAFATGLCPFAGKYGYRIGILAGFVCAVICSSTAEMHGGFVLYNGGFTAGLTALILIPILDFYKAKEKPPYLPQNLNK